MNKQRQHVLVWPLVALLAIGALVIISVSAQSTSGASFAKPSFTLNVDPGTPISGGRTISHSPISPAQRCRCTPIAARS
jgi:hypothetical protein